MTVVTLPSRTWREYADRISAAWRKSAEGFIETGQALIEAKADLGYGAFEAMVNRQKLFSLGTAERLMKIAGNPFLSKSAHGPTLPPSWRTLYELTKLPPETLRAKIADGTITPKMERRDVAKLRGKAGKKQRKTTRIVMKRLPPFEPIADCIADVHARIEETILLDGMNGERRRALIKGLRQAIDQLETNADAISKEEEENAGH